MKKFHFPLDRLYAWRAKQLEAEVVRLAQFQSEQESLRLKRLALLREEDLILQAMRELPSLNVENLQAADNYRQWCVRESERLVADERSAAARVATQKETVLEARRGVEGLRNIKDRRLKKWRSDLDKETEEMVAELATARWASGGNS